MWTFFHSSIKIMWFYFFEKCCFIKKGTISYDKSNLKKKSEAELRSQCFFYTRARYLWFMWKNYVLHFLTRIFDLRIYIISLTSLPKKDPQINFSHSVENIWIERQSRKVKWNFNFEKGFEKIRSFLLPKPKLHLPNLKKGGSKQPKWF